MPHIHEKIDFTSEVFVVYRDKVLLRKHDKYKLWLSVGGHIELDDDPNEAAAREVKEETGLDVVLFDDRAYKEESQDFAALISPQFLYRHRVNKTHDHVTFVYFARANSDAVINEGDEASDEVRWFTSHELDDPKYGVIERIRFYAHAALETLAGQ